MKEIPSYPKIFHLGEAFARNLPSSTIFEKDVVIEEKVDGSQFGFGVNEDGDFIARSRKQQIDLDFPPEMFKPGIDYLGSITKRVKDSFPPDTYFYAEYLRIPKHNTLKYDQTPTNHFVLFGAMTNGMWVDRETLEATATILGIDVIPELYRGHANPNVVHKLLETESYLGGQKIEGV